MRLCRSSLHIDTPLRFDAADLLVGKDIFGDPITSSELPRLLKFSSVSYRSRVLLHHSEDSSDLCASSSSPILPAPSTWARPFVVTSLSITVPISRSKMSSSRQKFKQKGRS